MPRKRPVEPQPFVIRESDIQGRGGFATRAIRKGERIAEYIGERISWKEAHRRYDDTATARHHTFLFSVTSRTVIDGAVGGNDTRFINHSCDPNCEAVDDGGRIFIEALRSISNDEELTYDYAYERDDTHTGEDEARYACRCGTAKCRGTILVPPAQTVSHTHHAAARQPHRHEAEASSGHRVGAPPSRSGKRTPPRRKTRGAQK